MSKARAYAIAPLKWRREKHKGATWKRVETIIGTLRYGKYRAFGDYGWQLRGSDDAGGQAKTEESARRAAEKWYRKQIRKALKPLGQPSAATKR